MEIVGMIPEAGWEGVDEECPEGFGKGGSTLEVPYGTIG